MHICITGAAGFIGSHLVRGCLQRGYRVTAVDDLSRGIRERIPAGVEFIQADVAEVADGSQGSFLAEERPDAVVHLAALLDAPGSQIPAGEFARVNELGTLHLLEGCRLAGVNKIVYASSAAVYGQAGEFPTGEHHGAAPISAYGITKYVPELYLEMYFRRFGLDYRVLRYANVFGPGQGTGGEAGVVAVFLDKLLSGEPPVIFGDGEQTRDFVYVEDVVEATLLALETDAKKGAGTGAGEKVFNVGRGAEVTVNGLLQYIQHIAGTEFEPRFAPARGGEVSRSCLRCDRAGRVLGWQPSFSLHQGLEKTFAWYRECCI